MAISNSTYSRGPEWKVKGRIEKAAADKTKYTNSRHDNRQPVTAYDGRQSKRKDKQ